VISLNSNFFKLKQKKIYNTQKVERFTIDLIIYIRKILYAISCSIL